jgi:hypothetical protein
MRSAWTGALLLLAVAAGAGGEPGPLRTPVGPYNAVFLAGGVGIRAALAPDSSLLAAGSPWSMSGWVRVDRLDGGALVIAALGEPEAHDCRCLITDGGQIALQLDGSGRLHSDRTLTAGTWHAVAATFDGSEAHLFVDGADAIARPAATRRAEPSLELAPESIADPAGAHHFGGAVALFTVEARALSAAELAARFATRPDFTLIAFHQVGVGWPWQEHAWRGLLEPQPAWTLPHGSAPAGTPVAALPPAQAPLLPLGRDRYALRAWRLSDAPAVTATPELLSAAGFADASWYQAVVPGTVLTTLIANGLYPDPDIGLNNLAIPESLNRQDYWYRTVFRAPPALAGRRLTLTFKGINYAAQVWLNGKRLGEIRGAFVRGVFDVSALVRPGADNALAVRVSPPPHPGIPHEQSVAAGPGENGGNLAIDGPTFIATEGWDWIPAIRDRNTGLWQDVELSASGALRLLDPQVISHLPLPRTDSAELEIHVPVANESAAPQRATVEASVAGVRVRKQQELAPGVTDVVLTAAEFPQLAIAQPRLWWPNGYGRPELYDLLLVVAADGAESDRRQLRFGIRELSYELSLFDRNGRLRRVEVDPAAARDVPLVDVRHEAIKRTATGWAESLTPAGEHSVAVRALPTAALTPYLAIRVNGVPIAARGGSWGMDDSRKRVGRERLEPYFRLHQAAHLNIIRNWLGQDTEDVFYDLADEYGLLILNDFWASTQDFQVEPQDPQLFLANAADVIRRYRNHPSIAVWFGRNEGVPQPLLNEGLAQLVQQLDGTRYFTGSSNRVNLQGSGPYNWRPAEQYFTELARGFSVEVGTPSLASLESLRAMIPAADRWPLGDTYAYHDWHFGGNGDTATFMAALTLGLGAPESLEDFERKAQLMNYESYRAIFEGFFAHLWTQNSGRLLWMTHPSWPSNTWQIYTSDYDAAAAYYAVAKACEPLHVQLDLPDHAVAVVNTTREPRRGLRLRSRVLSLTNRVLFERTERVDAAANAVTTLAALDLHAALATHGVVLVALTLSDAAGRVESSNVYWQSLGAADERQLVSLPPARLAVTARERPAAGATQVTIELRNAGATPALLAHATLRDAAGARVLPAYYSDNYVTLLAGDSVRIEALCPAGGAACSRVSVDGWNVPAANLLIAPGATERPPTTARSSP